MHREREMPIMLGETPIQLRAAIGMAIAWPGDTDVDAVLHRADEAMYENKWLIKSAAAASPGA